MHGFLKSRPYWDMLGAGPAEDQCAWAFDFRMMTPTSWWRVPFGMNIAGLPGDARAEYRIHKMVRAATIAVCAAEEILGPERLPRRTADRAVRNLSDAKIIWIHRDPVQSIASRIAIMGEAVKALTGQVDWKQQARIHLAIGRANFKATLENSMVDDPRIHNVRYSDFVRGPVSRSCEPFTKSMACRSVPTPRRPCAITSRTTKATATGNSNTRRM